MDLVINLMVKPAGPYLDIIRELRNNTDLPIASFQVSGEYAQIYAAAKVGWLDLNKTRDESLIAMDKIIGKFRNDYKVDKVALIALTDGGSNGMRQHGDIWLKLGKNYVDCSGYGSREQKISLTGRLISYLKKRHGIQAIGFFLVRRYKDLYWHFNCPYDKVALAKKTFNKDKVLADKNTACLLYTSDAADE